MKEIFNEGLSAFSDGEKLAANPYPRFSRENAEWAAGWREGKRLGLYVVYEDDDDNYKRYREWI